MAVKHVMVYHLLVFTARIITFIRFPSIIFVALGLHFHFIIRPIVIHSIVTTRELHRYILYILISFISFLPLVFKTPFLSPKQKDMQIII